MICWKIQKRNKIACLCWWLKCCQQCIAYGTFNDFAHFVTALKMYVKVKVYQDRQEDHVNTVEYSHVNISICVGLVVDLRPHLCERSCCGLSLAEQLWWSWVGLDNRRPREVLGSQREAAGLQCPLQCSRERCVCVSVCHLRYSVSRGSQSPQDKPRSTWFKSHDKKLHHATISCDTFSACILPWKLLSQSQLQYPLHTLRVRSSWNPTLLKCRLVCTNHFAKSPQLPCAACV